MKATLLSFLLEIDLNSNRPLPTRQPKRFFTQIVLRELMPEPLLLKILLTLKAHT